MAFAVDDYRALVQLLLEHPEWRAELRPLILGEEMAGLPGAVERLSAAVERLDQSVTRLDERVGTLETRLDSLDRGLADIGRTLKTIDSRVGRLEGNDMETRYFHHVGAWFGRWLRRPRAVSPDDLDLDDAVAAGRITEDELEAVRSLDLIVFGTTKPPAASHDAVIVAEISLTIDTPDVERAAARAAILRKAGFDARGFVGGEVLTAHGAEAAKAADVIVDLRTGY